jgi:thymidylate kinase
MMRAPDRRPPQRGAVIAFVGSEATGKSTMLSELSMSLAHHFDVVKLHAGKPPSTPLTAAPNYFLPALRALVPAQRSTRVDARHLGRGAADELRLPPLLFAIRAVLLGHDRRRLLRGAHASAAAGAVALCDRYPSSVIGAPDSPQLARWAGATVGHPLLSWLVRTETRMYADVPPADVVFHLWAPLDVTLERNRKRDKTEPEELVMLRHQQAASLRFDGSKVHHIDTTRPLERSLQEVHEVVWALLARPRLRRRADASSK